MNPGMVLRIGVKIIMTGVVVGKFVYSMLENNKCRR